MNELSKEQTEKVMYEVDPRQVPLSQRKIKKGVRPETEDTLLCSFRFKVYNVEKVEQLASQMRMSKTALIELMIHEWSENPIKLRRVQLERKREELQKALEETERNLKETYSTKI